MVERAEVMTTIRNLKNGADDDAGNLVSPSHPSHFLTWLKLRTKSQEKTPIFVVIPTQRKTSLPDPTTRKSDRVEDLDININRTVVEILAAPLV